MSNRITEKDLQSLVDRLNEITGNKKEQYTKDETTGRYVGNIGNYHLSFAYGGVTLHQMFNEGGGITTPLGGGYFTKRELYYKLHAFISGIQIGKENQS